MINIMIYKGQNIPFAKVLNFKTSRKDITAKTILKFVYLKKTDNELNNASASIKDCIRYKPNKTDLMEPYLLAVAHGYVYIAPDGQNTKEPFMSTSIWMSNYIYPSTLTTLANKNK